MTATTSNLLRRFISWFPLNGSAFAPGVPFLPVELWLQVLGLLEPRHIESLSLTCRGLRALVAPFVFHDFKMSLWTFPRGRNCMGLLTRPPAARKRLRARLDFYQSDRITSMVRRCVITSQTWQDFTPSVWMHSLEDELMLKFLPRLPNLETLELVTVRICSRRARALQKLNALKTIVLHQCRIDATKPPTLHAHRLVVHDQRDYENLIETKSLHSLKISDYILPRDTARLGQSMPQLRHLEIITCQWRSPKYLSFLRQCPHLESLSVITSDSLFPVTMPNVTFHNLKSYEGSVLLTPLFAQSSSVLHLSLLRPMETRQMPECLRQLNPTNRQLQTLHLSVHFLSPDLLDAVCEFPALRSLEILHYRIDWLLNRSAIRSVEGLISALLNAPLSSQIERISIYIGDDSGFSSKADHKEHRERLSALRCKYASLRYLEMEVGLFRPPGSVFRAVLMDS